MGADRVDVTLQRGEWHSDDPNKAVEGAAEDLDVGGGEGPHEEGDKRIQHLKLFHL